MTASLNPYISKFGETFDAGKSSQYKMAIQFTLDGLSFALLDTQTHSLVGIECYQSELLSNNHDLFRCLERALDSKNLNNKEFQSVTCIFCNRFNTIVPTPLFNEADQTKYFEFAHQLPEGYAITSTELKHTHCFNACAWSKSLQDKVLSKWKNAHLTHASSVFLESVMQNQEADGIFVQVHNRDFDMVVKKEGNLFFFNNFKFNTRDDFAYFLMFAIEQSGISGHELPVTFSGLILPSSEIISLCKRYVKNIHPVEKPQELNGNEVSDEIPYQYYHIEYQVLR